MPKSQDISSDEEYSDFSESDSDPDDDVEYKHIKTSNILTSKRISRKPDRYVDKDMRKLYLEDIPEEELHAAIYDSDIDSVISESSE